MTLIVIWVAFSILQLIGGLIVLTDSYITYRERQWVAIAILTFWLSPLWLLGLLGYGAYRLVRIAIGKE